MLVYGITIQPGKFKDLRYRIIFDAVHSMVGKPGQSFLDLRDDWTKRFGPITQFLTLGGPYPPRIAAEAMASVMPGKKLDAKQIAAGEGKERGMDA